MGCLKWRASELKREESGEIAMGRAEGETQDSACADSSSAHDILPRGEVSDLRGHQSASTCGAEVVEGRFDLADNRALLAIVVGSE
jgi:hypothetical protein